MLALVAFLTIPRPVAPGTVVLLLASRSGEALEPASVTIGGMHRVVAGEAPRAPEMRTVMQVSVPPGRYMVSVDRLPGPVPLQVAPNQVQPVLLAVAGGRVVPGGVYAGGENLNLGLSELGGQLAPLADFELIDQDGRRLERTALMGHDTVIAAFHTSCRETCPLYTGLLFQLRKAAPDVRLLEVSTDPAGDGIEALREYRSRIGADWAFATGPSDEVARFWGQFGVALSSVDSHTSALALVDRHGYIRAGWTGVPDVGGRLPPGLEAQLSPAGRRLLAGHGEGWGAPQVLGALKTLAKGAGPADPEAPNFTLPGLDGHQVELARLRGQPVVLNFWYSGCPPCRQELPLLQKASDQHPDVAVLLVNNREDAAAARTFAEADHVSAPVLLDRDGAVTARFRVAGFPTTIFLRPDGTEAARYSGPLSEEVLRTQLDVLGAAK